MHKRQEYLDKLTKIRDELMEKYGPVEGPQKVFDEAIIWNQQMRENTAFEVDIDSVWGRGIKNYFKSNEIDVESLWSVQPVIKN